MSDDSIFAIRHQLVSSEKRFPAVVTHPLVDYATADILK